MAAPTWITGQVLTAADVNSWFVPLAAYKTVDQPVTSSTTLVNDSALFVAVAASAVYDVTGMIYYAGGTAGASDLKWSMTWPAGASTPGIRQMGVNTSLVFQYFNVPSGGAVGTNGAATVIMLELKFTLAVSSTAGNLQFQWAQNTSSGTSTVVKAGSLLSLVRVG